jgi:outer membrane protein TolC
MKLLRYLYAVLFLSCCLMTNVQAGPMTLSLEDALDLALQNNLSLKTTALDGRSAERDVDTAWNLFLPSVSATLSNSGSTVVFQDNPIIKATTNTNTGLSAGLGVRFQLNPAVKDQLESYDVAWSLQQVTFDQAATEVKRNVTKLFYYLLAEKSNVELQRKNIALAEKQYMKVNANFESGYASELDLLSSQLGLERLKPALQQTLNAYEGQLLAFRVALGLPLDTELELSGTLPDKRLERSLQSLQEQIEGTYSLRLLDLNRKSLQVTRELQRKSSLMPTLSISGQYNMNLWNDKSIEDFVDSAQYSVSVSIPLDGYISGSRTQNALDKIDDSLDTLAVRKQQTRIQMEQAVITRVLTLRNLTEQIEVAIANKDLSKRVLEMQMAQYEAGYTDYLNVEKAQQDVLSAEQQIVYLRYQYATALVDLAYDLQIDITQL